MELNHSRRTIRATVLYYGPALAGKTTNLQVLHRLAASSRRGEMISVNTMQDRTLLFDLLPLRSRGFRGYDLEIRLMAVPGQLMYAATRRVALRTADAVVFVANSASDRLGETVQSFEEMKTFLLSRDDGSRLPTVVQYNKRDLPDVASTEELDRALGVPAGRGIEAVATDGRGLLESLGAVLQRLIGSLLQRYPNLSAVAGETPQVWVARTLREAFGEEAGEAAGQPLPAEVEPEVVKFHVGRASSTDDPSETQPEGMNAEARLSDRYVEAAWQLSGALEAANAAREAAEARLQDMRDALAAGQALQEGRALTATLQPFLSRLVAAVDAVSGAFFVADAEEQIETVAVNGLVSDPLAGLPGRARTALAALNAGQEPQALDGSRHSAVRDLLEAAGARSHSALAVPVRTSRGLQGLVVLFHSADQAPPRPRALMHLSHLAGAVAAPLELARRMRFRRGRQVGPAGPSPAPAAPAYAAHEEAELALAV